jgi:hypothetical protein
VSFYLPDDTCQLSQDEQAVLSHQIEVSCVNTPDMSAPMSATDDSPRNLTDDNDDSSEDPSYYERMFEELTASHVTHIPVYTESPRWIWKWADIETDDDADCSSHAEPMLAVNSRISQFPVSTASVDCDHYTPVSIVCEYASDMPDVSSYTYYYATTPYAADWSHYPDEPNIDVDDYLSYMTATNTTDVSNIVVSQVGPPSRLRWADVTDGAYPISAYVSQVPPRVTYIMRL